MLRDSAVVLYIAPENREEMATFITYMLHAIDPFIDPEETIELFLNLFEDWDGEVTIEDIDHLYNLASTTKFVYGQDRWN